MLLNFANLVRTIDYLMVQRGKYSAEDVKSSSSGRHAILVELSDQLKLDDFIESDLEEADSVLSFFTEAELQQIAVSGDAQELFEDRFKEYDSDGGDEFFAVDEVLQYISDTV